MPDPLPPGWTDEPKQTPGIVWDDEQPADDELTPIDTAAPGIVWDDEKPAGASFDPDAYLAEDPGTSNTEGENRYLGVVFDAALRNEPDKKAGVLRLSREFRIPTGVVEARYDDWKRAWEKAQFDPTEWRRANPELAKLALVHPDLGQLVMRDQPLSVLTKTFNTIADAWADLTDNPVADAAATLLTGGALGPGSGGPKAGSPEEAAAYAAREAARPAERAARDNPKRVAMVEDASSRYVAAERRHLIPLLRYAESAKQMEISKLGFDLLRKRATGQDTYELEKQILDLKRDALPRDYGEGAGEQALTDVMQAVASQVAVYEEAGPIAAGAALVGAAVGGAATKSTAGAARGAKMGAQLASPIAKAGVAYGSLRLEAGGTYLDLLDTKTDDGKPLSEWEARGGAIIYGSLAAAVEVWSTDQMLKTLGPVGASFRGAAGRAAMREMMRDQGFRQIAARVGKEWLKEGATEGVEEFTQSALEDVTKYLTRSQAAGKLQSGPAVDVQKGIESAYKGALGGLGLGGATSTISLATQAIAFGEAQAAARQAAAIAGLKDSPTAKAAPDFVAGAIADATAKTGQEVTHIYIDPTALLQQLAGKDARGVLTELMGPEGEESLQAAVATGTKLQVPLAKYLEKWAGTELAHQLIGDTTAQPGPTPRELGERAAEIEAYAKKIADETPIDEEVEAPAASRTLSLRAVEANAEQRATDLFIDPVSGLRNFEGWQVSTRPEGKQVAVITATDVKAINDAPGGGHDTSNALLRAIGAAVAKIDPEAARKGTNFLLHVSDEQELSRALEQLRAAMPDPSLRLEGAIGTDAEGALAALDASVDAKRKAGALPARGSTDFDLSKLPLLEKEIEPASTTLPADLVERAAKLQPGDFFSVYQDKAVPGVLSATGWERLPRKAFVASLDLRGLKHVNKRFGTEAGNQILARFTLAAQEMGAQAVDFAHLSGDEFAAQHDNREELESFLEDLRAELQSAGVTVTINGKRYSISPDFRQGIGEQTYGAADRALNAAKRDEQQARANQPPRLPEARRDLAGSEDRGGGADTPGSDVLEARRARARRRGTAPQAFDDRRGTRPEEVAQGEIPEAVERSRIAMGLAPLFRSPAEAGMTPEQWATYLGDQKRATSHAVLAAQHRARSAQLRETEAWWKAEEKTLRDEARGAYDALPGRVAQRMLRGQHEIVGTPIVLQRGAVEAVVGPVAARKFRLAAIGSHPDEVADLTGFASGSEMLHAVVALPGREEWARETARQQMQQRHPHVLDDRTKLSEEVNKGLHGDFTAQWLLREIAALRAKTGAPAEAPVESVKRAAEMLVERMLVADIRPKRSLRAERAASDRALRAAARGDYAQALVFKQQQLLNMFVYRAAVEVAEEMTAADQFLQERTTDTYRAALGKANRALLGAHDAVLAAAGLREPVAEVREALEAIDEAAALAEADATPFEFDLDALRNLVLQPKEWGALTPGEARNLRDAAKSIRAIANARNEITLSGEKQAVEAVVARIVEESKSLPDLGKAPLSREQVSRLRRAFDTAIGLQGELLDPEQIFEMLGPTARSVFERYLDAKTTKYAIARQALAPLVKAWETLPADTLKRRWETLPELDTSLPIPEDLNLDGPRDRLWLLMVALNMGNESNRERLLGGFGWSAKQVLTTLDKHLTKAEWDWAQSVWTLLDRELWPLVAAKEERKTGLTPGKIKATPIVTSHGVYAGGYFPARFDPRASVGDVGERQAEAGIASLYGPGYVRASTLKSHTKKRADHYANVINLDWSVVPSHVAQVIHDVAFDEYVRDTGRVLFHPKVQETLYRRLGEKRSAEPRTWLKFVANAQANSGAVRSSELARVLGGLKARMVRGSIGLSLTVAAGDFANVFVAMAEGDVRPDYGTAAFAAAFPLSPTYPSMRRLALSKSVELRNRLDAHADQKRQEFLKEIGKRRGRMTRALEAVANTAWFFQEQTDKMCATQIWLARYWEELANKKSEADASSSADAAVRRQLPGVERAEMPALVRDPGAVGAILVFYGYFSKRFNALARLGREPVTAVTKAIRSGVGRDYADAGLATAKFAGRALAAMFVFNVVAEVIARRGPRDDEEPEEYLLRKMLSAPFNTLPFGAVAEPIISKAVTGHESSISSRSAPALSLVEGVLKSVGKIADEDASDSERIWAAVETALVAANFPARQPRRTLEYLESFFSGTEEPENVGEFVEGVMKGPRRY